MMSWTPQMEEAYQALGVIHNGRSTILKKARHRSTQQLVVVKSFRLEKEGHAELNIIRLLRNHPNFTSFREVFQGEHCIHIVMDYNSANLPVYIKAQQNNLPRHDIKSIATQLLEGLAYMHENQICYLAMHPKNVMLQRGVDGSFQVKLVHFKRAVMMDQQGSSVQDQMRMMLTEHGLSPAAQPKVGLAPGGGARGLKKQDSMAHSHANYSTPEMLSTCKYDAPEVLVGTQYKTASDIWSFGCLLAEMVFGEPLFEGESPSEVVHAIFDQVGNPPQALVDAMKDRVAFRSIISKLPDEAVEPSAFPLMERLMERLRDDSQLLKVLMSCLCMDPSQRPTAHQLLALFDVEYMGALAAGSSLKTLGSGGSHSQGLVRLPSRSESGGMSMANSRSSLPDLSLKFRMGSLSGAGGQLPPSAFDDLSMPEGRVTPAALLSLVRNQSGSGLPPTSDKILNRLPERTSANGGLMMNRSSSVLPGYNSRTSLPGNSLGSVLPAELREIRQEASAPSLAPPAKTFERQLSMGRLNMSRYNSSDLPTDSPSQLSMPQPPSGPAPRKTPNNARSSFSGAAGINPLRTHSGGITAPENTIMRTSSCGMGALSQDPVMAKMAMALKANAAGGNGGGGSRIVLKSLSIRAGGGIEDEAPEEFAW